MTKFWRWEARNRALMPLFSSEMDVVVQRRDRHRDAVVEDLMVALGGEQAGEFPSPARDKPNGSRNDPAKHQRPAF
jgi:hypothetical protein